MLIVQNDATLGQRAAAVAFQESLNELQTTYHNDDDPDARKKALFTLKELKAALRTSFDNDEDMPSAYFEKRNFNNNGTTAALQMKSVVVL